MRGAAALALLLAGCGGGGDRANVTDEQLNRLSTPKAVEDPRPASVRLEPLLRADVANAACVFGRGGGVILAASEADAVARIGGQLLHFTHSSPMGPTGGFFEDRQISISVGRTAETRDDDGAWQALLTVTNRRTEFQARLNGLWSCTGQGEAHP
jgi:hypothetical protein